MGLAIGNENIRLKRTYRNLFKIPGFIFYEESEGHVQLLQGLLGLVPNPGPGPGDPDGVEGSGVLEEDDARELILRRPVHDVDRAKNLSDNNARRVTSGPPHLFDLNTCSQRYRLCWGVVEATLIGSERVSVANREHGRVTTRDMVREHGASPNSLKATFASLVAKGLLARHGGGRSTWYSLP